MSTFCVLQPISCWYFTLSFRKTSPKYFARFLSSVDMLGMPVLHEMTENGIGHGDGFCCERYARSLFSSISKEHYRSFQDSSCGGTRALHFDCTLISRSSVCPTARRTSVECSGGLVSGRRRGVCTPLCKRFGRETSRDKPEKRMTKRSVTEIAVQDYAYQ